MPSTAILVTFEFQVAEITFSFWYRLSEMLYAADREQVVRFFGPYVERLIYSLVRHCQMEPDNVSAQCSTVSRR